MYNELNKLKYVCIYLMLRYCSWSPNVRRLIYKADDTDGSLE